MRSGHYRFPVIDNLIRIRNLTVALLGGQLLQRDTIAQTSRVVQTSNARRIWTGATTDARGMAKIGATLARTQGKWRARTAKRTKYTIDRGMKRWVGGTVGDG